jgi:chorismate mutase
MANKLDLTPIAEWGFFKLPPRPCVIAGPCSAESEEQVVETAKALKEMGINVFRAGVWKPRTHPGCFEGAGVPALKWLQRVQKEFGLKICTEVANEKHVYECIKHGIDMVWIGARTSANPFLMQEIAEALRDTDFPVLVKNPVNPDIDLWIGALERLSAQGVKMLGAIHRGVSTSSKIKYRNDPQWDMAVEMRSRYPELPIFVDPSHMAGKRAYLQELSQKAMNLGFDGLMIESHCQPECALSDSAQQLTPKDLYTLLTTIMVREATSADDVYNERLSQLRTQIDIIDENIIHNLVLRLRTCKEIGKLKSQNNVSIVQTERWERVVENAVSAANSHGLDPDIIKKLFILIHKASVEEQND